MDAHSFCSLCLWIIFLVSGLFAMGPKVIPITSGKSAIVIALVLMLNCWLGWLPTLLTIPLCTLLLLALLRIAARWMNRDQSDSYRTGL